MAVSEPSAACRQFEAELETCLEGEARPFVAFHARQCASCGALLWDLQLIQQTARELPLDEPSPVVWANIHARLEAEGAWDRPASGWRRIFAARALPHAIPVGALATLVVLGSLLTSPFNNHQLPGSSHETVSNSRLDRMTSSLPAGEEAVLASLSDLEHSFRVQEASMAPDLKATYEKSLVSLDGSIRECRDSLQHEPGNTLAHEYLLTAYSRKAEILSSALEFEGR